MVVDINKIIAKVQDGLKNCSEQNNIHFMDVQLLINSAGEVNLYDANKLVRKVDVCKVFKISTMENLIYPIVPFLKKAVLALAKDKVIDPKIAVARIFTKKI